MPEAPTLHAMLPVPEALSLQPILYAAIGLYAAVGLLCSAIIVIANLQQRPRGTPLEELVRLGFTPEEIARLITYRRAVRDGFYTEQLDQAAGARPSGRPPA